MKPIEEQIKRKKDKIKPHKTPERVDIIWQGEEKELEVRRLGGCEYIATPCLDTETINIDYEAY